MRDLRRALLGLGLSACLGAAGCAALGTDLVRDNTVRLEVVQSKYARISRIVVLGRDDAMLVNGDVRRRSTQWGLIPGHVDLEVIGPRGDVLERKSVAYQRLSAKSLYAMFTATLRLPPRNSILRLIHDPDQRHGRGAGAGR